MDILRGSLVEQRNTTECHNSLPSGPLICSPILLTHIKLVSKRVQKMTGEISLSSHRADDEGELGALGWVGYAGETRGGATA